MVHGKIRKKLVIFGFSASSRGSWASGCGKIRRYNRIVV